MAAHPALMAVSTANAVTPAGAFHVPRPKSGILCPLASVTSAPHAREIATNLVKQFVFSTSAFHCSTFSIRLLSTTPDTKRKMCLRRRSFHFDTNHYKRPAASKIYLLLYMSYTARQMKTTTTVEEKHDTSAFELLSRRNTFLPPEQLLA